MRYRVRYWGPDLAAGQPDRGSASYAYEGTAVRNFTAIIASRRVRAPGSHVLLEDKDTGAVLARWDGCDDDADYLTVVSPALASMYGIK